MLKVLKTIQDELYIIMEYSLKHYKLGNSDLIRDIHIELRDNFFTFMMPNYADYVNYGRRAGAKMPPTSAIVQWCREKGIPTDNTTVYKIRQGIAKNGIKARPFIDQILDLAEHDWNTEWAEMVFKEIIKDLNDWFK